MRERLTVEDIEKRVRGLQADGWVWITGGEPTDWKDLPELPKLLQVRYRVALATAGRRAINHDDWDFVSVSPHNHGPVVNHGDQVNIVPGLNGLQLDGKSMERYDGFGARFVTPMDGGDNLNECINFVMSSRGHWRLGWQIHKQIGLR